MSVSTEEVASEEQQTQETSQEAVTENNENPESNAPESNQESVFDFEKSKAKLEYVSVLSAIIGLISTGLFKISSLGRYLYFPFDINNCEFKLTNTDFIVWIISMLLCALAITYCIVANSIKNKILKIIINRSKGIPKTNKKLILFRILSFVIPLTIYPVLFFLSLQLLSWFNEIVVFKDIISILFTYSYILIISFSFFMLTEEIPVKIIYKIILFAGLIYVCLIFIDYNYSNARNQKQFEIIVAEDIEGKSQKYVVISKGGAYSAYQCYIDEDNNILMINGDIHRYFPLEDTETRLYDFENIVLSNINSC